jgi:hypothetical protein
MRFVCKWEAAHIDETETSIGAQAILDAAAKATAIWEEDVDLPPDDKDDSPSYSSWPVARLVSRAVRKADADPTRRDA